jgi:prevent-host-death family protein
MVEVNVKDARSKLSTLLDRVEQGEEVIITRRGKKVARMIQPLATQSLPSLKDFRASLQVRGKPMSQTVIDARNEGRY